MSSSVKFIRRYDLLLIAVALALVLIYAAVGSGGFPLDDSWIHQVYGRNLAERGEWAFIAGEPSAASTSPLYTVLLAVGYMLNIPFMVWAHGLGWLALVITGLTGARMAAQFLPSQRFIAPVTGLALIGAWHLVWASVAGMETMLFCMFTLVLMFYTWGELADRGALMWANGLRGLGFGVLAALTALTRPEGLLLVGLCGLVVLAIYLPGQWQRLLVWSVAAGLSFVLVLAPYLLLNVQMTGGLLPNTAAAKSAQFAPVLAAISYPERVLNMLYPLIAGGQVLLLPGIIFYAVRVTRASLGDRRQLAYLLPLLWAVGLILLYAARLPANYQHGRYVIPALPTLIFAGVTGLLLLAEAVKKHMAGRVLTRAVGAAAALVFVYFATAVGPSVYQTDVAIIEEEMVASARWIADNIAADELLAIHDIGAVGYFAPRPLLDIAGLVNPEVIPILNDKEALYTLMQAEDARYLLAFPDQVPGDDLTDQRLCPVFTTGGPAAIRAGGANMTVYELSWLGVCVHE